MNPNQSELVNQLRAFGRDCVVNGDMTPAAERVLWRILDKHGASGQVPTEEPR